MNNNKNTDAVWTIYPIIAGEFGLCPDSYIFRGGKTDYGYNIPSIIYLLQNEKNNILVDASFSSPEEVTEKMEIYCSREQAIDITLKKYDVSTEKINTIILTHLHWDHAGGIDFFPNASFLCQEDEYKWLSQFYEWEVGYPDWFSENIIKNKDRFKFISGDIKVESGIDIYLSGGHTLGSQMIMVRTEKGLCMITGDNAMVYENVIKNIPIGLFHSLQKCTNAIERIKKSADFFIPSHDYRVKNKMEIYSQGQIK
jgi:glyoxylase-like metal-dependent hydrolase (beta-lactamase superfamily II)